MRKAIVRYLGESDPFYLLKGKYMRSLKKTKKDITE